MHDILGVVSARQMLAKRLRGEKAELTAVLQPAVFVPESVTGMELLENFRSSGGQVAFVIDEYGEVLGLVTLQDLVEAITGEFKPDAAGDEWAVQRDDGSWLLDGLIPIPELKDRIGLRAVPEEAKGVITRYQACSCCCWVDYRKPPTPCSGRTGSSRLSTWTASASTRCWPPAYRQRTAPSPIPPADQQY
jgi:hypothetical protein